MNYNAPQNADAVCWKLKYLLNQRFLAIRLLTFDQQLLQHLVGISGFVVLAQMIDNN